MIATAISVAHGNIVRSGVPENARLDSVPASAPPDSVPASVPSESGADDSGFVWEKATELPEFVYEAKKKGVLHVLAYVREYSTLTSYRDTVSLFREKLVDFMLRPDRRVRYRGWTLPRILKSKSYYRFTNSAGLDSVSDECRFYFSWSDRMWLPHSEALPAKIRNLSGTDTLRGKYSAKEIWQRKDGNVAVDINVLADTAAVRWVPGFEHYFRNGQDFYKFLVRYNYDNITGDSIPPHELTSSSFHIESEGRGRNLFRFTRRNEPYFVSSDVDIYILDKENISVREAKKRENAKFDSSTFEILQPEDAPALPAETLALIDRVNGIDKNAIRLDRTPDRRLISRFAGTKKRSLIGRAFDYFKKITGR